MSKLSNITSVITGDLINSRKVKDPKKWLSPLKKTLKTQGESPVAWEIYRGDSFQLEVRNPSDALMTAIRIKATLRSIKNLDVRLAIGIGQKNTNAKRITESNGEAFIFSGEKLETLKAEKQNIAIKSRWTSFDAEINLCLRLALIAMDNWKSGTAELVSFILQHPDLNQKQLSKKLKITQSSVSEGISRAYLAEILQLDSFYREKISKLI